jgi:hypothetical protein
MHTAQAPAPAPSVQLPKILVGDWTTDFVSASSLQLGLRFQGDGLYELISISSPSFREKGIAAVEGSLIHFKPVESSARQGGYSMRWKVDRAGSRDILELLDPADGNLLIFARER